ncbi:trehalose 6-phosphate phosphatase [Rhodococcus sp. 27YEA15]|uniref:trehalose-phosphatase n=1 Tax=Rhodococcus sp. 27YEA15 TaxID=3156259 RepID=UPI003C79BB00
MRTASDVIARLAADPVHSALIMDFDGVLAPIVDDPSSSALLPGAAEVLTALSSRLALVGLLSGRPVSFLRDRVSGDGLALMGSYGVETWTSEGVEVLDSVAAWMPAVAAAEAELRHAFSGSAFEGIHVESKGLGVAVHWRRAQDRSAASKNVHSITVAVAQRTGLRLEPGKMVEELRPPVNEDKGTGLRRAVAVAQVRTVAYAGDDRGDLPAFAAALAMGGEALVVRGADIADEVAAVAGVMIDGPHAYLEWMTDLARELA